MHRQTSEEAKKRNAESECHRNAANDVSHQRQATRSAETPRKHRVLTIPTQAPDLQKYLVHHRMSA